MNKILLVEDNEAITMGLEFLLTEEGYLFESASGAKEARRRMEKERFDLILLDIALPDGDGYQLCKEIRDRQAAPVIFLTARDEEKDVVLGFDLDAGKVYQGGRELELIEPVNGESVWKDFLKEKGEGIHHLKFEVESINETIREFQKMGVECTQYGSAVGPNAGKTWAYFDTVKQLGYVTEILNCRVGEVVEES